MSPPPAVLQEGEEPDILSAMTIMMAAVERYKELCEGRCCGEAGGRAGAGQGQGRGHHSGRAFVVIASWPKN